MIDGFWCLQDGAEMDLRDLVDCCAKEFEYTLREVVKLAQTKCDTSSTRIQICSSELEGRKGCFCVDHGNVCGRNTEDQQEVNSFLYLRFQFGSKCAPLAQSICKHRNLVTSANRVDIRSYLVSLDGHKVPQLSAGSARSHNSVDAHH